ncbi:MAG: Crp/Fnr family transcriptional regulator [Verrucomicrobiales bacterium]|nr:Crp/Fnr family transcriptional regulator [Verrucomicrobiales bacterium]
MSTLIDYCTGLPVREFAAGEVILEENRKDGRCYVLKRGVVEISKRGTLINRLSSAGSVLGEVAVLLDQSRAASVVAVEPTEAFEIEDGARFFAARPELMGLVARLLARRLKNLTDEFVELREQLETAVEDADEDEGVHVATLNAVLRRLVDHHLDREF